MDPLKPLRRLPEKARAYYYRVAMSVGGVVLAFDALDGTVTYGGVVGAALGLVAALLATAHTSRE